MKIPKKEGAKKRKLISSTSTIGSKKKKQAIEVPTPHVQEIVAEEVDYTKYCYCKTTATEKEEPMVGCDGENCPFHGWIHYSCLASDEDTTKDKFYCRECIKKHRNANKKKR